MGTRIATITSYTLAYSQTSQKAGIAREQADAMAQANASAFENMAKAQQLATKQDILATKHELEIALEKTKAELNDNIAKTKESIIRGTVGNYGGVNNTCNNSYWNRDCFIEIAIFAPWLDME